MSLVTIIQTVPEPPIQVDGDNVFLRVWYTGDFVAGDGVTPIEGGTGQSGFYYNIECNKNGDGEVVIPAFAIQATTESNPTANFFGQLYVNNAPNRVIFGGASGWQLPTLFGTSINFGQLALYNRIKRLLFPPNTYPTTDEVIRLINLIAGATSYAGFEILGRTQLSIAPLVTIEPIAVGNNDPRVIDVSSYSSFNAAVTAIGSTPTTFNITTAITGVTSATIPATLTLRFLQGGSLSLTTGQTLTVLGSIVASPTKIFNNALSGQGTVSFAGNQAGTRLSPNWWGAVFDGVTDDTTAWSACIAAAYTMKVATVDLVEGISIVSSLSFPAYASAGNQGISITLEGVGQPPTEAGSFPGTLQVSTRSSIIKSTTAGAVGVFIQQGSPFQAVSLTLKNMIVRREDNPDGPAINWVNGFGFYMENTIIDTGRYTTSVVQPTHTNATAVALPGASNAGTQSIRGDCWIQGYYTGLLAGEHTVQDGHLAISGCAVAVEFPAGQLHPCMFDRLHVYNNTTNLKFTGTAFINIQQLAIEHANNNGVPAWQETVYDIDDASNLGRGLISYNVIKAFVGADSTFTRNGGYFLSTSELKHAAEKSVFIRNDANISIPDSTLTTLTFNTVDDNQAQADVSNTARIKPTQYGVTDVFTNIRFAANATGIRTVQIIKHTVAGDVVVATEQVASVGAAFATIIALCIPVSFTNIAEYVSVRVQQTSGGALDVEATAAPDFTSPRFIIRY